MKTTDAFQRAVDYIEAHLCEELCPEKIAEQAYLSSAYFQRLFSVPFGMSLGEYIRGRRLTLAGKEILGTNRKIIEIALQYGYESPESFSRAFTRFRGLPPSAVRRRGGGLHLLEKLSVQYHIGGEHMEKKWTDRGYTVTENAPVYYTQDMDQTVAWFEQVLGWHGAIDQRDAQGRGTYGCVLSLPAELHSMALVPFNGFHLFLGQPSCQTVGFIRVSNIENLAASIRESGWPQLSEITDQPWGGRECTVTTTDGSRIRFFQIN